jgi:hypothetical protein
LRDDGVAKASELVDAVGDALRDARDAFGLVTPSNQVSGYPINQQTQAGFSEPPICPVADIACPRVCCDSSGLDGGARPVIVSFQSLLVGVGHRITAPTTLSRLIWLGGREELCPSCAVGVGHMRVASTSVTPA